MNNQAILDAVNAKKAEEVRRLQQIEDNKKITQEVQNKTDQANIIELANIIYNHQRFKEHITSLHNYGYGVNFSTEDLPSKYHKYITDRWAKELHKSFTSMFSDKIIVYTCEFKYITWGGQDSESGSSENLHINWTFL